MAGGSFPLLSLPEANKASTEFWILCCRNVYLVIEGIRAFGTNALHSGVATNRHATTRIRASIPWLLVEIEEGYNRGIYIVLFWVLLMLM